MRNALPPRALLGTSAAILELQADTRLAEQNDAQVLITGEHGVGKRALALLIHTRSSRKSAAFASVDVAGVSESELVSKLFGPGNPARPSSDGLLQIARQGTLFINGIDEISPPMQARLSRILETEDVLTTDPDDAWDPLDVRIIVGAPPHLFERVEAGQFQDVLFYRLNVIHLIVPPLRERLDDLPTHLRDVLAAYAESSGIDPPDVASETLAQLKAYPWPGNDVELDQLARLLIKRGSATITPRDLPEEFMRS